MVHADPANETRYRCPGEEHPIEAAVHLARLTNYYPRCAACAHRHDTGVLAHATVARLAEAWAPEKAGPVQPEAIGGVLHNEFTPAAARRMAGLLGQMIDSSGLSRDPSWEGRDWRAAHFAPIVLVGYDLAEPLPEMVAAVVAGLMFAGCRVLESGELTAPALGFAREQHAAQAALLVSQLGDRPGTAGLRIWDQKGRPWSSPGSLDVFRRMDGAAPTRPTRRAASVVSIAGARAHREMLAAIGAADQSVIPFGPTPSGEAPRVCFATNSPAVRRLLAALPQTARWIAGDDHQVEVPHAGDEAARVSRAGHGAPVVAPRAIRSWLARLSDAVARSRSDLGFYIDEQGERLRVLDHHGGLLPAWAVMAWLVDELVDAEESSDATVLLVGDDVPSDECAALARVVNAFGGELAPCPAGREATFDALVATGARGAIDGAGRIYLGGPTITCDAIALALRLLSSLARCEGRPAQAIAERAML